MPPGKKPFVYTSHIYEQDIVYLQTTLLTWYEVYGRTFPWREDNRSEYELIVAEILLQRTRAKTISSFFLSFISQFSDWQSLVNTSDNDLEIFLRPIGLASQKAKRLKSLAIEMVKRNCVLPSQRSELETMPFFGQYIANAIEVLIFQRPAPLLDVNMERVLERYFGPRRLVDIRYDPYLQELAKRFVDYPRLREINWAILDFAALICQVAVPKCNHCILNMNCAYFEKNLINTT